MTRQPAVSARSDAAARPKKLFVLDTNVLMHDPTSVYRFEEHDVFLPIMTLEELDNHKKGLSEIARNARQVTRTLDEIVTSMDEAIDQGIKLSEPSHQLASGRLFLQTEAIASD
ncbi:MAG TPA: PIN domain-containing protein, partial [Accumulibacter sp.]|nr:PIN domain-containing protein [Accumulibacter sp.]